ncbi:MAG: hypothetical protein AB7P37_23205 [Ramlibacter sp.]
MSDPRIDRYKTALAKVNAVLYESWVPIGFVGGLPQDEYEAYAVRCLSLLASGAEEKDIAAYLVSAAAGLADDPALHVERSAAAASRLMRYKGEAHGIAP